MELINRVNMAGGGTVCAGFPSGHPSLHGHFDSAAHLAELDSQFEIPVARFLVGQPSAECQSDYRVLLFTARTAFSVDFTGFRQLVYSAALFRHRRLRLLGHFFDPSASKWHEQASGFWWLHRCLEHGHDDRYTPLLRYGFLRLFEVRWWH